MFRHIRPARRSGTGVLYAQSMAYADGQTFKTGALVIAGAAGTITECAADPTEVTGVALEGAGTRPGFDLANSSQVIHVTGRKQEATVGIADREQVWAIDGSTDGSTRATPAVTDINSGGYGVAKDADGIWYLDLNETTAKVFEIVDVDVDQKIYYVKFLAAVISL